MGLTLIVDGDADSVRIEDPVLGTGLTNSSIPGVTTLIGDLLNGGDEADTIVKDKSTITGGA